MKKKLVIIGIAVLLIVGLVIYFWPMDLGKIGEDSAVLYASHIEYYIVEGEPESELMEFSDRTPLHMEAVEELLDGKYYHRSFGTYFDEGFIEDSWEYLQLIFHDDGENSIFVEIADNDRVRINGKVYYMRNSEALIGKLLEVLE